MIVFPYRVVVNLVELNLVFAIKWCNDNCGEDMFKNKNGTWYWDYCVYDSTDDFCSQRFEFMQQEDAVMFALRWS